MPILSVCLSVCLSISLHCKRKASLSAFYFTLSCAVLFHVTLPYYLIQLLLCLPLPLVYALGVQSVSLWVYLSYCLLARWPAHVHFFDFISCIISCTSVFFLKSWLLTLSLLVTPIKTLSIALSLWLVASFPASCCCPSFCPIREYTGITHWLKICFFNVSGSSSSRNMKLSLPDFTQASWILLFTSPDVSFSSEILLPKYM